MNRRAYSLLAPQASPLGLAVVPRLHRLKQLIWLYLILLVFEGAIRKWVLPGLASPLLIIRDPVALLILVEGLRQGLFPRAVSAYISIGVAIIAIALAVVIGHGNLPVALYGARPLMLHFPAMFVIAAALDRQDVLAMGKFVVALSILMTAILALQFYSPQSAWINRSVGGGEGAGFSGALGYLRPPGTFSFTSGVPPFYALTAGFLIYFWLEAPKANRLLTIPAAAALVLAVPLSISRALLLQVGIVGFFALASTAFASRPGLFAKTIRILFVLAVLVAIASRFEYFQTALTVLETRFVMANESEGGLESVLVDRYLGGLWGAIAKSPTHSFWGMGLGAGTNAGSSLLTGGVQFLVSEGEWGRLIGEMGPVLGILIIAVRVGVTALAALRSWAALGRGDLLPWLLLSSAVFIVPQGQWGQPTALGFSTIIGGLLLASLKAPPQARRIA